MTSFKITLVPDGESVIVSSKKRADEYSQFNTLVKNPIVKVEEVS